MTMLKSMINAYHLIIVFLIQKNYKYIYMSLAKATPLETISYMLHSSSHLVQLCTLTIARGMSRNVLLILGPYINSGKVQIF